jgi:hypothetical protein
MMGGRGGMSGIDRNHRIGIGGMGGVSDMPTEGSIVRPVCTTGKKKSRRTGENSFVRRDVGVPVEW